MTRIRLRTPQFLRSSRGRIALVSTLAALVWGAMIVCQGIDGPTNSADWDLMSEVGRRLALGDTLYVDTMDQKGPLCYATYAIEWLLMRTQPAAYAFSNVAVWAMLTSSSAITACIMEEERKPWLHIVAQALLAGVIFVPHVGCLEEWFAPLGLLGLLWVRRLARGRDVPDVCWAMVGLFAAYTLWAKFTCCAQFAFLLCYAASRENTKGLGRAAAIALLACFLASAAVLAWLWYVGSLNGMVEHYLRAAIDGYAGRMSMIKHLTGDNPSSTHVTSFFVGLPLAAWSMFMATRSSRSSLLGVLVGAASIFYAVCCFSTFVGYYRMQLAVLVVVGACEVTGSPWRLPPLRWLDARGWWRRLVWVASLVGIVAATASSCGNVQSSIREANDQIATLHSTVGDSDSVLVWQFDNTWVYGELGLDYHYVMPARYNASQDLWDKTAGADLAAGRWEYVISAVGSDAEVGHNLIINDGRYKIVGLSHGMAIAVASGGDGSTPVTGDLIHNPPYRLP